MTTEEKAKAYDKALEQAAALHRFSSDLKETKRMEDLFPQLKESEDEKIRKALIRFHKSTIDIDGIKGKEVIAWLEKQGEQKPVEKEFTFKAIPRLLEMIQPSERAKFYCGKLADTLDKDGYHSDANIVKESIKIMNGEKVPMATMNEQKPVEWSQEEETKRADSMYLIGQFKKCLATDECSIQMAQDCVEWLKSLRPKKQWKPTEEQLGALVSKLPLIKGSGDRAQTILESLYEQLKSL